jgi:hypothetical protein
VTAASFIAALIAEGFRVASNCALLATVTSKAWKAASTIATGNVLTGSARLHPSPSLPQKA